MSQDSSTRGFIVHELGHGLAEVAHGGLSRATAKDPTMLADYSRAVGWFNTSLYDIGVPAVAAKLVAGSEPPAEYRIHKGNWTESRWIEQPISSYMTTAPSEDFAEAIRAYVQQPEVLRTRSPRRWAFIRDRRQLWKPGQVPPGPRPGDLPAPSRTSVAV